MRIPFVSRYLKRCRLMVQVNKKTGAFDDESMSINLNIMEGMTQDEIDKDMGLTYDLIDQRVKRNNIATLAATKEKEAHEKMIADLKKQEGDLKKEIQALESSVTKLRGQERHLTKTQKVVSIGA